MSPLRAFCSLPIIAGWELAKPLWGPLWTTSGARRGVIYVAGHPLLSGGCAGLPGCFCFPKRKLYVLLKARYSLTVLKVPLNSNQSINQSWGVAYTDIVSWRKECRKRQHNHDRFWLFRFNVLSCVLFSELVLSFLLTFSHITPKAYYFLSFSLTSTICGTVFFSRQGISYFCWKCHWISNQPDTVAVVSGILRCVGFWCD